jgi:hypothetical protein
MLRRGMSPGRKEEAGMPHPPTHTAMLLPTLAEAKLLAALARSVQLAPLADQLNKSRRLPAPTPRPVPSLDLAVCPPSLPPLPHSP